MSKLKKDDEYPDVYKDTTMIKMMNKVIETMKKEKDYCENEMGEL
jgi:hypothetical protein